MVRRILRTERFEHHSVLLDREVLLLWLTIVLTILLLGYRFAGILHSRAALSDLTVAQTSGLAAHASGSAGPHALENRKD